jgi:hypothetical protein
VGSAGLVSCADTKPGRHKLSKSALFMKSPLTLPANMSDMVPKAVLKTARPHAHEHPRFVYN